MIFFLNSLEDDSGSSRRTRLLRLCSYLREKYKHMCRQERASIRQKRYRYAFRKALLHAASNNPDCAGQLIQELRGASRNSSRYSQMSYVLVGEPATNFHPVHRFPKIDQVSSIVL